MSHKKYDWDADGQQVQYLPTYTLIWILLIDTEGKQPCTIF